MLLSAGFVLLAGLIGGELVSLPVQVEAAGAIMPQTDPLDIRTGAGGIVAAIPILPGQTITAGQTLARIATPDHPAGVSVTAPSDGMVLSVPAALGATVAAGAPVAVLLPAQSPLSAMMFVPSATARQLRPGMTVRIAVEAGRSLTLIGTVRTIALRPSGPQEIARAIGNQAVAQRLTDLGAVIGIDVALRGPEDRDLAGLLCTATIALSSQPLLRVLLPNTGG